MARTLSANYPVIRINKGVLLNTFPKYDVKINKYLLILNIFSLGEF